MGRVLSRAEGGEESASVSRRLHEKFYFCIYEQLNVQNRGKKKKGEVSSGGRCVAGTGLGSAELGQKQLGQRSIAHFANGYRKLGQRRKRENLCKGGHKSLLSRGLGKPHGNVGICSRTEMKEPKNWKIVL